MSLSHPLLLVVLGTMLVGMLTSSPVTADRKDDAAKVITSDQMDDVMDDLMHVMDKLKDEAEKVNEGKGVTSEEEKNDATSDDLPVLSAEVKENEIPFGPQNIVKNPDDERPGSYKDHLTQTIQDDAQRSEYPLQRRKREPITLAIIAAVTGIIGAVTGVVSSGMDAADQAVGTDEQILEVLNEQDKKLDKMNEKIDELISVTESMSNTITIVSMKPDFDILFRASRHLKERTLEDGRYGPDILFKYKTEKDDIGGVQRTLEDINSYLTHDRYVLGNKNFMEWLIEDNRNCDAMQYAQLLALQGQAYEWWKILTVALCQYKKGNKANKANDVSCVTENRELVRQISETEQNTMEQQQQAVKELSLIKYMFSDKDHARCAVGMGALLPGKTAEETLEAIDKINVKVYKKLMDEGGEGITPLHIAASLGNLDDVKLLVSNGAEVNRNRNRAGWTPLILATLSRHDDDLDGHGDHLQVIEYLLSNEADADITDVSGYAALHYAALLGDLSAVKSLVENGADPKVMNPQNQWTPWVCAALAEKWDVVMYLVPWYNGTQ
jgi:hypothetical protein